MAVCEWFDQCESEVVADVVHPILGDVPICERHVQWLMEDMSEDMVPNPTKMIPPLAARKARELRARLAHLEA